MPVRPVREPKLIASHRASACGMSERLERNALRSRPTITARTAGRAHDSRNPRDEAEPSHGSPVCSLDAVARLADLSLKTPQHEAGHLFLDERSCRLALTRGRVREQEAFASSSSPTSSATGGGGIRPSALSRNRSALTAPAPPRPVMCGDNGEGRARAVPTVAPQAHSARICRLGAG
jgi:hypothetical protein